MNELKKIYIKDLEIENNLLLTLFLIFMLVFMIWLCFSIKEKSDLKEKNAKLQQQVIDYKWQLEQVQYIIKYQRGE